MSNEALNQALDALRAAQDHLAPSKTDNSELWYKYADAIVAIQSALEQRMAECPHCEYNKKRAHNWREEAYRLAGHRLPNTADVGDLVYIHDSFVLPKDLFGIVTKRKHAEPVFDDRYPPVRVEVLVFAEKEKICSWYEPQHLTVLERGYA